MLYRKTVLRLLFWSEITSDAQYDIPPRRQTRKSVRMMNRTTYSHIFSFNSDEERQVYPLSTLKRIEYLHI